jgi:hypothetical protein
MGSPAGNDGIVDTMSFTSTHLHKSASDAKEQYGNCWEARQKYMDHSLLDCCSFDVERWHNKRGWLQGELCTCINDAYPKSRCDYKPTRKIPFKYASGRLQSKGNQLKKEKWCKDDIQKACPLTKHRNDKARCCFLVQHWKAIGYDLDLLEERSWQGTNASSKELEDDDSLHAINISSASVFDAALMDSRSQGSGKGKHGKGSMHWSLQQSKEEGNLDDSLQSKCGA